MQSEREKCSSAKLSIPLRLFYKIRLFRTGGVIGEFLMLAYLSTALLAMPVRLALLANGHGPLGRLPVGFRAKTRRCLAHTKKSPILQNSRKTSPAHLPTASAAFAGMRKEDSLMETNEYPMIEAFIQLPGFNPNNHSTMQGLFIGSGADAIRPCPVKRGGPFLNQ